MKKIFSVVASLLLALTLLWILQSQPAQLVEADGIQNYAGRVTIDSGTAHTADWSSTAWSQQSYGSVFVQVTQDITDATDSVTYYMYYSLDPVACASVSNWTVGYDTVLVQNPAVAASRYISYVVSDPVQYTPYITNTTQATTTAPIEVLYGNATNTTDFTATYSYADVAAVAASVTRVNSAQSFSITGDGTLGLRFETHGAFCAKVYGDITTGRTVTTTIYVAPTDIYK